MKGQVCLEFLIVFLAFTVIVSFFLVFEKNVVMKITANSVSESVKYSDLYDYCSFIFLNENVFLSKNFSFDGFDFSRIECVSNFTYYEGVLAVDSVKKWFL